MASSNTPKEPVSPPRPTVPPLPPRRLKRQRSRDGNPESPKQAKPTREFETWLEEALASYTGATDDPHRYLFDPCRAGRLIPGTQNVFGYILARPSSPASPNSRFGSIISPFAEDDDEEDDNAVNSQANNDAKSDNTDESKEAKPLD